MIPEIQLGCAALVKVHHDALGIGADSERRNERDASRSAGEAAMAVQFAAVRLFAFHLDVIAPRGAVATLRAKQLVEDGPLQLFGEARFVG